MEVLAHIHYLVILQSKLSVMLENVVGLVNWGGLNRDSLILLFRFQRAKVQRFEIPTFINSQSRQEHLCLEEYFVGNL